ncbi:MAG: hypothetical protein ACYTAF_10880, partial [Planctomycetota bacterium]
YDEKMNKLSLKMNVSYIPYGDEGAAGAARQEKQEDNAMKHGGKANVANRAAAKGTALYDNHRWDLVDATKDGKVQVEDMDEKDLPEEMQKMTPEERKQHVEKMRRERGRIQEEINELAKKRDEHIKEELEKRSEDLKDSFDENARKMTREQAEKKGFRFE